MTALEEQIQRIVLRAIQLPECPVKRQHAIANRAWLFEKIKALIEQEKSKNDKA